MFFTLCSIKWSLHSYLYFYIEKCDATSQMSWYNPLGAICLPIDQTCSNSFPTFYKNESMLKCTACNSNTYLHAGTCVTQCPTNFIPNANNYCICSQSGELTVDNKCLAIPVCPIQMGWDSLSSSCVSC